MFLLAVLLCLLIVPVCTQNYSDYCPSIHLNQSGSTFVSPYYPETYVNNLDCDYQVSAPEGSYIIVTFQFFHIESHLNCEFDALTAYDGPSTEDDVLAKLCGSLMPTPILSNHDSMLITFTSDGSSVESGFQGEVTFRKAKRPLLYNVSGAHFTSPNYPDISEDDDRTHYIATASRGQYIAVTFHSFNIQYSTDCKKDNVKLFDGNSTKASVLATLCGSIERQTFFTSGNEVLIIFTTDQNGTDSGFEGVFTFHEDNCHGIINSTGSFVTSPNFPEKYENFLKCDFIVTIPDESKVSEISFFEFDLDNREHCLGDNVEIFDGGETSVFPSVKLCGSNLPPSFISHSNFVIIRFTSDEVEAGSGFQMRVNFISEPCRTCNYLHRYYGECPEHSLPPTFDEQEKLNRLPPVEYLRCRTLTGESTESYRGDHYWMISDCPNGTDTFLMTRCRAIESETYPSKFSTPPVLSKSLNVLFKNEFCAACNLVSRDDIQLITVYSECEQCEDKYAIQEGEEIEIEPNSCRILPHTTLPRKCFVISEKKDIVCPVPKVFVSERHHLTNLFSHVTVLGPRCARDEVFLNGLCVEIPNYCEHNPTISLLILSVNTARYNCSYLNGRSEECFFKQILSYEAKNDLQFQLDAISVGGDGSIDYDGAFSTFSTPWMRTAPPLWWNNSEYPEIFFYLPKNLTSKPGWKLNIISAIASFLDLDVPSNDASARDCYLNSVELLEFCPPDEAADSDLECKGHVIEMAVNTYQTTNAMIHSLHTNSKWYKGVSWFGHKTRFRLGNNYTKSLIVCLKTRTEGKYETNTPYFILSNLCCVIAVLSLILTFLVYLITPSLRNTFGTVMMINVLTFALGLTFVQFIDPYVTHITGLCETLAILTHWLWLSVFAWMTILAFDLRETFNIKNMRVVNKISRKKLACYFSIGWGLPSLIVSVCVIVWTSGSVSLFYGSHEGRICWIYESGASAVVIGVPLIFCLLVNLVLFAMIIKGILAHRETSTAARLHSRQTNGSISELFITIKISVLMGFTWLFGYIAPLTNIDEFNYLFFLFILLQGISIFALYGASKRVRKLWKKNLETRFSSQSTNQSNPRTQNSDNV